MRKSMRRFGLGWSRERVDSIPGVIQSNGRRGVKRPHDLSRAKAEGPPEPVFDLGFGCNAKRVVDGGGKVGWAKRLGNGEGAQTVGLPDQLAADHAGSGEDSGEYFGPMVAPGDIPGRQLRDSRRSAKFPQHDDECFVQHAPGFKIIKKRRDGTVQRGQEVVFQTREVGHVGVPGLDDAHRGLNNRDANFDQAAGEQERASEQMMPIAVDQPGVFAVDIKGLAHAPARKHGDRGILMTQKILPGGGGGGLAQEVPALVKSPSIQAVGKCEAVVGSFRTGWIELKLPRVMPRAKETSILAGPGQRSLDEP